MDKTTLNKLQHNEIMFKGLRKKLNDREFAVMLKEYMDDNNYISQRQLGRDLNIPHSTIQDWLLPLRLENKEYKQMKDNGLSETEIYRQLRNNKKTDKKKLLKKTKQDVLLEEIEKLDKNKESSDIGDIFVIRELKKMENISKRILYEIKHFTYDNKSEIINKLKDVKNTLNRIEMYLDKK